MIIPNEVVLTKTDQNKWQKNLLGFLRPVAVLYIGTVIAVIGANGGVVQLKDFIPNSYTVGGAILYILNGALDYLNKLTAE